MPYHTCRSFHQALRGPASLSEGDNRLSEGATGFWRPYQALGGCYQALRGPTRLSEGATRLYEAIPGSMCVLLGYLRVLPGSPLYSYIRLSEALSGSQRVLTGSLRVRLGFPMPYHTRRGCYQALRGPARLSEGDNRFSEGATGFQRPYQALKGCYLAL